ncbi:MAG: Signal recognition particle core component [Watsoniomyces obsoletus]|nr:MAG: Signal recognition particle core component [Watsoniomyces obsoletus]
MAPGTDNLIKLLRRVTLDDHNEVLQSAEAVLKTSKDDIQAQHIKIVALLKLDRYSEALEFLESTKNQDLEQRARLERAYGLYKLGKWAEARHIASQTDDAGRGLKHVEAQAAYRLEQFQDAAQLYAQLASESAEVENEDVDLKINIGAIDAQLQWAGQGYSVRRSKPTREDLEAFETTYNAACGSIARGELRQADILLKRAIDLCNALEDWSEEEKNAECSPIVAQRIYVLSKLDKLDEAAALYQKLPLESISDQITRTIARNNSLLFSKEASSNPYMLQRLFQTPESKDINDIPFQFQANLFQHNRYTQDLMVSKSAGVARSTTKYLTKEPMPTLSSKVNTISVMNAAAHVQNENKDKPEFKVILGLLEKRPKDVGLLMTIIQLLMAAYHPGAALNQIQKFMKRLEDERDFDVRFAPGLVCLLVTLLQRQGQKEQIRMELKKAARYWRGRGENKKRKAGGGSSGDGNALILLRVAGTELVKSNNPLDISRAKGIFETLYAEDKNDRVALAGLVAATTTTSTDEDKEIMMLKKGFTPIQQLTSGIDPGALEEAGIPIPLGKPEQSSSSSKKPSSKKRAAEEGNAEPGEVNKKRRTRQSRLPNEENRKKPIDPERWLPLRDRSSYRPKGKKAKIKAAGLTQGGIVVGTGAGDGGSGSGAGGLESKAEKAKAKSGKKGKR